MTADSDGADSSERNPYYKAIYGAVEASIRTGGSAKGALFWEWVVRSDGEVLDMAWPDGRHPYGVSVNDTTFMCAWPARCSFRLLTANLCQGQKTVPGAQHVISAPLQF